MGLTKNHNGVVSRKEQQPATGFPVAGFNLTTIISVTYFLVSVAFYFKTYDSAQVKITMAEIGLGLVLFIYTLKLILHGRPQNLRSTLPFILVAASAFISFANSSFPLASIQEFTRRFLFIGTAVVVVLEFKSSDHDEFIKWIMSAWVICVAYGVVQFFDTRIFNGYDIHIDPFSWRRAFEGRIFSSFGNPNFFGNFLVITIPIVTATALKWGWFWSMCPYLAGSLLCLYATEAKGAWVGFSVSAASFIILSSVAGKRIRKKAVILSSFFVLFLGALAVGNYSKARFQSLSFRIYTWKAVARLIIEKPLFGHGIGTFWIIYPRVRPPEIILIEGKSNTETDHAENEYLEILHDEGIFGLVAFISLVLWISYLGVKRVSESRAPPYLMMGYLSAWWGALAHWNFDVSARFVSSGIFVFMLPALVASEAGLNEN